MLVGAKDPDQVKEHGARQMSNLRTMSWNVLKKFCKIRRTTFSWRCISSINTMRFIMIIDPHLHCGAMTKKPIPTVPAVPTRRVRWSFCLRRWMRRGWIKRLLFSRSTIFLIIAMSRTVSKGIPISSRRRHLWIPHHPMQRMSWSVCIEKRGLVGCAFICRVMAILQVWLHMIRIRCGRVPGISVCASICLAGLRIMRLSNLLLPGFPRSMCG